MLDSMSTAVRAVLHKKGAAAAGEKVAAAEKKMLLTEKKVHEFVVISRWSMFCGHAVGACFWRPRWTVATDGSHAGTSSQS